MDIEKIAKAIEADAGEAIVGLRESLREMERGEFAREYTPEQLLLRAARKALGMSQTQFAELIDTPVATLRDWEQGRFKPPGSVRVLCKIAIRDPEALLSAAA